MKPLNIDRVQLALIIFAVAWFTAGVVLVVCCELESQATARRVAMCQTDMECEIASGISVTESRK